jgi:hypothetical protein
MAPERANEHENAHSDMKPGPFILLLALASLAGSVLAAEGGLPPSAEAVAARIGEAEQARQKAAELGTEWLATHKLIQQAREEAGAGNLQKAMQLAELAQAQGELAAAQAAREAEAWQRRVVR